MHYHGRKCPELSLKTPSLVTKNEAGNCPKDPEKMSSHVTVTNDKTWTRAAVTDSAALLPVTSPSPQPHDRKVS